MPSRSDKHWEVQLSDDGDFLRYRIAKEAGKLVDFVVQYKVTVDGRRLPVVRYDGSHPRCHFDRNSRDGDKDEQRWLDESQSSNECLTLGQQELRQNWQRHRSRFFEDLV
jgi:hypothetical protein